jgi:hypothetical protein
MTYFDPQYTASLIVLGAIALGGASLLLAWLFYR